MKIKNYNDYETMSMDAAEQIFELIMKKPDSNICLATGGSPTGMYEHLLYLIKQHAFDTSKLTFTKLDEWCGVAMDDPCTCENYIQTNILSKISYGNYISFDSMASNFDDEVLRVHDLLNAKPIDICILGLGMNGHLGLNEPADELVLDAHVATISAKTKTHELMMGKNIEYGMTLGMGEILDAKHIVMLVQGENKHAAKKAFFKGTVSTMFPSTFLWLHKDVDVFVVECK